MYIRLLVFYNELSYFTQKFKIFRLGETCGTKLNSN